MTATLELRDDVMLRVKALASREHKEVGELMTELIEQGVDKHGTDLRSTGKRGIDFSKFPPPLVLRDGHLPTTEEILEAIREGRE